MNANLFTVERLGPSVVFGYNLDFFHKSFVKIHVDIDAHEGSDVLLLGFNTSKMEFT